MNSIQRLSGITLLLITLLLLPANAWSIGLDEAKATGLVGELPNGYLAAVNEPASAEVRSLVQKINAERKAKYTEIAQKRGTSVNNVEALAGKAAVERTAPGHYIQLNGAWRKK